MNVNRMGVLISHLETNVKDYEFHMGNWKRCAVGHGCNIEEFKKAGLVLRENNEYMDAYVPVFNGMICFDAAASFFEISVPEAIKLFYDHNGLRTRQDEIDILRHAMVKAMQQMKAGDYAEAVCTAPLYNASAFSEVE